MDRAQPTAVAAGPPHHPGDAEDDTEPGRTGVLDLVLAAASRRPDDPAVTDAAGQLSYRQLLGRAGSVAAALRAAGLTVGARVAVCVPRGADLPAALLGCWLAGGVYLPLDPAAPDERLRAVLTDARPAVVLTHPETRDRLTPLTSAPLLDATGATGLPAGAPEQSGPGDDAYVIYTSGSTGLPKGVVVGHAALANVVRELTAVLGVGPGSTWMSMAPAGFDIAMAELCVPLASGARLLIPSATDLRDPQRLLTLTARESVDRMQAVPSQWQVLLNAGFSAPQMRAMVGGEALTAALAGRLRERVGFLVNGYGPTETTVLSTLWPVPRAVAADGVRIGRPITGTRLYLLDDHGRDVPPGAIGELWIGGVGVARGYLDRPDLTAERFVPESDEAAPHTAGRRYRTGDLCRLASDGELEYLGRVDDQIKLRGHRLEPGEIEACLLNLPGVTQAAVVVTARSGGVEALTAHLVVEGPEPAAAEVRAHVARHLPASHVPDAVVCLASMPLTANGKTDRLALAAGRVPGGLAGSPSEAPAAAPDAPTPTASAPDAFADRVLALCAEALGLPVVRPSDDLFELGAQSLTFMQISAALKAEFDVVLPVPLLFEAADAGEIVTEARKTRNSR